jgi:hypothetical protein
MKTIEEVKPNVYLQQTKKSWRQIYPIKKDLSKPFAKGNINWKNMFKMDWMTMILIIGILLVCLSYKHDMQKCGEFYTKSYMNALQSKCFRNCMSSCNLSQIDYLNPSNYNLSNLNLSLNKDGGQNSS